MSSWLVRVTSSLSIAIERTKSERNPTEKNDVKARGWTSFAYCLKMTAKQPLNTAEAAAVKYPGFILPPAGARAPTRRSRLHSSTGSPACRRSPRSLPPRRRFREFRERGKRTNVLQFTITANNFGVIWLHGANDQVLRVYLGR